MVSKLKVLMMPVMLLGLAGCGTGGGGDDGSIEIVFWHTFGQKPAEALQKKTNDFIDLVKKNENVDVKITLAYQGGYSDMPKKVTTGMATGDMPTMAIAYADHVADYMAYEQGDAGKYVVDFDKFLKDETLTFGTDRYLGDTEKESDMIQSYMDEGRQFSRKGTYLIPYMKSTEIMIYNLTACQAAMAIAHPEIAKDKVKEYMKTITWEGLLELARTAYENRATISSNLEYPIYYDSDSNLFITELYQQGIPYSSIGSDGKGQIDFEPADQLAKVKNLVGSLKQAHDDHLLTTKGTEGTYASNNFKEAKTIFSIGSTGGTGYTIPDAGSFEVAFAKVPTMGSDDSKTAYISQGPSICFLRNPSFSDNKNEQTLKYAWKYVKYLTSKNVNVSLCVTGSEGYSPVRNSCYTTETYNDFIEEGESYAEAALVTQNDINGRYFNSAVFPGSATLRTQVGAVITQVFKGGDIDQNLADAINNTKKDIK